MTWLTSRWPTATSGHASITVGMKALSGNASVAIGTAANAKGSSCW